MKTSKLKKLMTYLDRSGTYMLDSLPEFKSIYQTILDSHNTSETNNPIQTSVDKILYMKKVQSEYVVVAYDKRHSTPRLRKSLLTIHDNNIKKLLKDYEYTCKQNLQYIKDLYVKLDLDSEIALTDSLIDSIDEQHLDVVFRYVEDIKEGYKICTEPANLCSKCNTDLQMKVAYVESNDDKDDRNMFDIDMQNLTEQNGIDISSCTYHEVIRSCDVVSTTENSDKSRKSQTFTETHVSNLLQGESGTQSVSNLTNDKTASSSHPQQCKTDLECDALQNDEIYIKEANDIVIQNVQSSVDESEILSDDIEVSVLVNNMSQDQTSGLVMNEQPKEGLRDMTHVDKIACTSTEVEPQQSYDSAVMEQKHATENMQKCESKDTNESFVEVAHSAGSTTEVSPHKEKQLIKDEINNLVGPKPKRQKLTKNRLQVNVKPTKTTDKSTSSPHKETSYAVILSKSRMKKS